MAVLIRRHLAFDDNITSSKRQSSAMPPQIKQDLNRSGWESTDFPSVCESCLPENPYVKMLKEDYGAECKLVGIPLILTRVGRRG